MATTTIIDDDNSSNTVGGTTDNDIIHGNGGDDDIFGNGGVFDQLFGDEGDDFLGSLFGNDLLNGGTGNDHLSSNSGNDTLIGGSGQDRMEGGTDDDTYVLDNGFDDQVIELVNAGIDTIKSSATFFDLPDNVENLTLTGSGNIEGNGNALSNNITGNKGDDQLFGFDGNDNLIGGGGNDRLSAGFGDNFIDGGAGTDDQVFESGDTDFRLNNFVLAFTGGVDSLLNIESAQIDGGDSGNTINASAFTGRVILQGGGGDDVLLSGSGDGEFFGGTGNNFIDGGDGAGIDILGESADSGFTLTNTTLTGFNIIDTFSGIEEVHLLGGKSSNRLIASEFTIGKVFLFGGNGNDTLLGGSGDDTLKGDSGNDSLNGGLGKDSMNGSFGDDTYTVDNSGDQVIEGERDFANTGIDTVRAFASFTLGDTIENLTLLESANINGTGNVFDNTITGNSGNNKLDGLDGKDQLSGFAGNDTLLGGAGNDFLFGGEDKDILTGKAGNDQLVGESGQDKFVYDTGAAFKSVDVGIDLITDFIHGTDKIVLDKTTFTTINSTADNGFSLAGEFEVVGSNAAAATSSADIIYNSTNGNLFYNQNGTAAGFGTGAQFATLGSTTHPILSGTDFLIQA